MFAAVRALALREGLPVRNAGGAMGAALKGAGLRSNDAFEEGFFDAGATVANLVHIIENLSEGSTELMCHPAGIPKFTTAEMRYAWLVWKPHHTGRPALWWLSTARFKTPPDPRGRR